MELEELRYRENVDTAWQTLRFKPILVEIAPQLPGGDMSRLREQTPIEDLPPLPRSLLWVYVALAGLLILTLAMLWFIWHERRPGIPAQVADRRRPA